MLDVNALIQNIKIEPRPYQRRIIEKAYESFITKGLRSVLIDSPVGSGKTICGLTIAKALHELHGLRIGWVAMRKFLLHQAAKESTSKEFKLPIKFISMFDKDPPKDLDVLIVDEAQHDATSSMGHIHATIAPKFILGLSGTAYRSDRVKLCFDATVRDAGIASLIKDGYLSKYHHFSITDWKVQTVVKHYLLEPQRWGKTIMYFHRLDQCFDAEKLLLAAGVKVTVVAGNTDTDVQIKDFIAGNYDVVINCMKLTEGFDCPELKTVFCRPSCKPPTIQMCGRVLRKCVDYEFKQIVQMNKTPYPFPKTAMAALQHIYTENSWRTFEINKNIDNVNRKVIRAIAATEVKIPDFIKKNLSLSGNGRRWGVRAQRASVAGSSTVNNGPVILPRNIRKEENSGSNWANNEAASGGYRPEYVKDDIINE